MTCRAIPYEGKAPYIFVSYCHKDLETLCPVFEQIVLDGYRMWYDDGNHGGDDWLDNIENHLEDSSVVVAFISENSSLSHNCKSEIVYALKCKKKVIPVLIETTDLPKGLRMQLSHLHYLTASDFSSHKALLNKICEVAECASCKAPAGSLKLKEASSGHSAGTNTPEKKKGSFWDNLILKSGPVKTGTSEASAASGKKAQKIRLTAVVKKDPVSKATPTDDPKSDILNHNSIAQLHQEEENAAKIASELDEENTHLQQDDEDTVYQKSSDDETLRDTTDPDTDKTVRFSSRSMALLLHPAEQCVHVLKTPQTKIGRSPIKCDVVLEGNDSISKHHADIIQYNGKVFLRDANSANGTFLDGKPLEPDQQVQLDNPAIFQLNDETLILITGLPARRFAAQKSISLLMNEKNTAVCLMDSDKLLLNRSHKWPDGTLGDPKIHRAAHAYLQEGEGGIYLTDESPQGGNGTYWNSRRMKPGDSQLLTTGDRIRLGDTTLEFLSITF